MDRSILFVIIVLALSSLVITACDVSSDNQTVDSNVGTLAVELTDAPLNFPGIDEINLTIEDIAVRGADNGEFLLIQDDPVNINIMNFRNGDFQIIGGNGRVPTGMFDQLRFQITDIKIELEDSSEDIDVPIPSRAKSGYTIDFDPDIEVLGARNTSILLDLDLYQSFKQRREGQNFFPSFTFNPVIRYALLGNTGTIMGVTLREGSFEVGDALIKLFDGSKLIGTTFSEDNGDFGFIGIDPGSYRLTVEKEGLQKDTLETTVEMQTETNVSFRLDSTASENN